MPKRIVIIAGPNGAGKTTFARDFLPREAECPDFINADLIAAGWARVLPLRQPCRASGMHRRFRAGAMRDTTSN